MTHEYSKNILSSSLERRLRNAMVRILDEFDHRILTNSSSEDSELFKFNLKNIVNDAIRANRDEISDYDLIYRPVRLRPNGVLSVTKEFIEALDNISFDIKNDRPRVIITARKDQAHILESIKSEFGVGIAYISNENSYYIACGIEDCIKITTLFDKYRLTPSARQNYVKWRIELVHLYFRS